MDRLPFISATKESFGILCVFYLINLITSIILIRKQYSASLYFIIMTPFLLSYILISYLHFKAITSHEYDYRNYQSNYTGPLMTIIILTSQALFNIDLKECELNLLIKGIRRLYHLYKCSLFLSSILTALFIPFYCLLLLSPYTRRHVGQYETKLMILYQMLSIIPCMILYLMMMSQPHIIDDIDIIDIHSIEILFRENQSPTHDYCHFYIFIGFLSCLTYIIYLIYTIDVLIHRNDYQYIPIEMCISKTCLVMDIMFISWIICSGTFRVWMIWLIPILLPLFRAFIMNIYSHWFNNVSLMWKCFNYIQKYDAYLSKLDILFCYEHNVLHSKSTKQCPVIYHYWNSLTKQRKYDQLRLTNFQNWIFVVLFNIVIILLITLWIIIALFPFGWVMFISTNPSYFQIILIILYLITVIVFIVTENRTIKQFIVSRQLLIFCMMDWDQVLPPTLYVSWESIQKTCETLMIFKITSNVLPIDIVTVIFKYILYDGDITRKAYCCDTLVENQYISSFNAKLKEKYPWSRKGIKCLVMKGDKLESGHYYCHSLFQLEPLSHLWSPPQGTYMCGPL